MKINEKENDNVRIVLETDEKNFFDFIQKVKRLGQDAETHSDINKHMRMIVVNSISKPYMEVKGWTSRTKDLYHAGYFDYDQVLWWIAKTEMELLMKRFNLAPFYVFTTSEETIDENGESYANYIAVNLTKKPFAEWHEIHKGTHTDVAHNIVSRNFRWKTYVLRLGKKGSKSAPKFKCVVGDITKEYNQPISNAHLEVLQELYPEIPSIKYVKKDQYGKGDIYFTGYKTGSP